VRVLERKLTSSSPQTQLSVVSALISSCFVVCGCSKAPTSSLSRLALGQEGVDLPSFPDYVRSSVSASCLRSSNSRVGSVKILPEAVTRQAPRRVIRRGALMWGRAQYP
jgi:hypothetical protein